MPIQVSALEVSDIPGAIDSIQLAFANDPYNLWVYDDRSKVITNNKLPGDTSFMILRSLLGINPESVHSQETDFRDQFNLTRNRISLSIRCNWGIRNCLFYVAKDPENHGEKVLGIAMWMRPRPANKVLSWGEYVDDKWQDWR